MFQIISDGSCDLSDDQLHAAKVEIVPFYVALDGEHYIKEGKELSVSDFYQFCIQYPGSLPRTSMPSVQDYMDCFEPYLARGTDILCYCITKSFSGSINSALIARNLLLETYPERKIVVEDSTLATGLQGLLLLELARYAQEGHSLKETWEKGEELKKTASIYFTIDNLRYLAMGGRIGKIKSLAVQGLRLRPLIRFNDGELHPLGVSIGRKHSFDKITEILKDVMISQGVDPSNYSFALGWGCDREEAEPFFQQIRTLFWRQFGQIPDFVPIQIGATIGVHTGPYPVGIGMIKKA